ncbi:ATP-grasp domain-containing protein [Streptomyces sp. NPDC057794]|uniref:ATP-grasp domain-containing protein n=1 Tax=Streptomyces sp. NPDC057794 TaxID=3346251 RepID=UPI00367A6803
MTIPSAPLLVLGAGSRHYREHALRGLAARRLIILVDPAPPAWARPYVQDEWHVDLTDTESALAALTQEARQEGAVGVCTYLEHHVELAAQLASHLGLPGSSPSSIASCRDKARTRKLWQEHGVSSAWSVPVDDQEEAVEHARLLGYPVVVKPRGLTGGVGVQRADSDTDVRQAYQAAAQESALGPYARTAPGVLVEEYLDGEEISVETVVEGDAIHLVAVTRTQLVHGPQFLTQGHTVDARDPLLHDPVVVWTVTQAVQALGVTRGVLHVELRLIPHGPALVEVNATPGSDLIPVLVQLATGVDLVAATADLATGAAPDLTVTRQQSAAVAFLYPASRGRVTAQSATASLRRQPWLKRLVWTRHLGEIVSAPPRATVDDRLAHLVVTGDTPSHCQDRLEEALAQISSRVGATPTANCAP